MDVQAHVGAVMPILRQFVMTAAAPDTERRNASGIHWLLLAGLIVSLRAKRILELGVAAGGTTRPLLAGATLTDGVVVSVDVSARPRVSFPPIVRRRWNFYRRDALTFLQRAAAAGDRWDLIYIDDWHAYSHVLRELELIKDSLNPRGVVVLHDLMHTHTTPNYVEYTDDNYSDVWGAWRPEPAVAVGGNDPQPYSGHREEFADGGPYRAVVEFVRANPGWEYATVPTGHGLTILRPRRIVSRPGG